MLCKRNHPGKKFEVIEAGLRELCPEGPVELLAALRWLYLRPELAAYLCGEGGEDPQALSQLRQAGVPEYLALAVYRLWRKSKMKREKTGDNPLKTRENERIQRTD